MVNQTSIKCQNCGTTIVSKDILKNQLEVTISKEFQQISNPENKKKIKDLEMNNN